MAEQSRDVREERGESGCRAVQESDQAVASAFGFDESLADVEQQAARLDLARAPQICRVDPEPAERIPSGHHRVRCEDGAEFEREGVKQSLELLRADEQRCRQAAFLPRRNFRRARPEIGGRQVLHQGERGRARVPGGLRVVDHDGFKARAEDFVQLAVEGPNGVRDVHESIVEWGPMRLRELNVGCFGGGTGLPSVLGGLKSNPWLTPDAVVTMFDSGGSSGVLRDELGVLPPGDILKCALALSRNEREARRVLLARLPTMEHARLGGHTGGNLLLSMMQSYSGDFLNAIDGLRALLGCKGRVWPVSVEQSSVCAEYGDGSITRSEVEVDAGQSSGRFVRRIWLEPPVSIHPAVSGAISRFDAAIIGPGSFYTSLMPIFLVRGVAEALREMKGPVILIANLLSEGRGMLGFTAADAVARLEEAIQRPVDVVIANVKWPTPKILGRYALEHKEPLAPGNLPDHVELVGGEFWTGEIARHNRLRLAYTLWSVLSRRLLGDA